MGESSEAGNRPLPAAASSIAAGFGLGPIDQISFAVASVEQSLPWYDVQAPSSLGHTVIELIQPVAPERSGGTR